VAAKVRQAQNYGYTRIGTASDFTGSSVLGSGEIFDQEALYQHVYAYLGLMGVEALQPILQTRNPFAPTPPAMVSA
jgi:hypothetical protein